MAEIASRSASAQDSGGTTQEAKDKVQEAAGQAQEKAQEVAGQARGKLRDQLDQRTGDAGQRVSTMADDARSVSEELRRQGKDGPARLADQAADRVERVGSYLSESNADRILRDAEDFGRRQPMAVMLGGLALGFAASRFLKASSRERYRSSPGRSYSAGEPTSPGEGSAGTSGRFQRAGDGLAGGSGFDTPAGV
jgi:hypothetical protein